MIVKRPLYLDQVHEFVDKPFVKVITGIRRCGKSALMQMLRDELIARGVSGKRIVSLNFESLAYADYLTVEKLYPYLTGMISGKERHYIFLDEIQEVEGWERLVNSLMVDKDVDLYLTGSNSRLLSSELATYLAGRYVEIHLFTLSFAEHLQFLHQTHPDHEVDRYQEFKNYLKLGGFPVLHTFDYPEETAWKIVSDIYSSALLRDTVQRFNIRDVELLERVVRFVFDNIGNKFSGKNVADYFKSQQRKIDQNTVYNYLNALESAFIIHRIPRYDVRGKEILKTNEKYFVGDPALVHATMGYRDRLIGGLLENIVMLELARRGYRVFVGKVGDLEIDFIAEKKDEKIYVQVCFRMGEQSTIDRELKPLLAVRDQYPKYLVTMDENWQGNEQGIRGMHIADFLLLGRY